LTGVITMSKNKSGATLRKKPALVMVFGENNNDRVSIKHLIRALAPRAPTVKVFNSPLVLIKGRALAEQRKSARSIVDVVAAKKVTDNVVAVFAHEDCDAVEPAHDALSIAIEERLADAGVAQPCAVTPAWELEAWWFMWPDAVQKVNVNWRRLNRDGTNVGMISNAKETLRRELRPKSRSDKTDDYAESDSPTIAQHILDDNLIDRPAAKSHSFERFKAKVHQIWPPAKR
jgi:hypothetical protein